MVSKPLKLPKKGARDLELHHALKQASPLVRGSYWRMAPELYQALTGEMNQLCVENGLRFEHCLHNILKRSRL